MKVFNCAVVLCGALGLALCLPANKNEQNSEKTPDKEVDFVPQGDQFFAGYPPGIIDINAGSPFDEKPFGHNPFSSTFDGFEATFKRMRDFMNRLLGQIPSDSGTVADFPELHIPNLGNIDLGKGNTTSVTKIINGHKVTINDTEYKSDEANGSSVFKVHIVEVHPDEVDTTTKKDAQTVLPPKRDPESIEKFTNEIPKIKDNEGSKWDENIETLDQADMVPPQELSGQQWNKITNIENFEDNRIDSVPSKPYDLSNDIYVNQLLADSGARTNPDAEVFQPLDGRLISRQYYPETHGVSPLAYYPGNVYNQQNAQQVQRLRSNPYYPPHPVEDYPYYNRYPEQIVIVPLSDQQSYFIPPVAQVSSSSTQGLNSNIQTVSSSSSKTAPHTTSTT